jgi:hypothetical protein
MKMTLYSRRGTVIICLAAVLFAALIPIAPNLFLIALITPLWFFSGATVSAPLRIIYEQIPTQQALAFPAVSPRPPPAL